LSGAPDYSGRNTFAARTGIFIRAGGRGGVGVGKRLPDILLSSVLSVKLCESTSIRYNILLPNQLLPIIHPPAYNSTLFSATIERVAE
jgi:hypothetical protein